MMRIASSSSSIWTTKSRFQRVSMPNDGVTGFLLPAGIHQLQEGIEEGLCRLFTRNTVFTQIGHRFVVIPDEGNTV